MAEDFLAEPVFPTNSGKDTETAPAGNSGDEEGADSGNGFEGDADEAKTEGDEGEPAGTGEPEKPKAKAKESAPADERPEEPATRKTKFDFIMERKRKQAEREEAKAKGADGEDGDGDDSDNVAPEDEATIEKVFRKKYGAQFEAVERQRFENEVNEFFQKDEIAKFATDKEKALFREYAVHPTRKDIPYDELMVTIIGAKRLMEIWAGIEREAAKKAGQSKSGGWSGQRQDGASGKPDYSTMSDADFEAEQHKVRTAR